ncbi:flagellar hook-basal body complex protein FliE [bacterium]|nr:flagellar hook-basal body complex protein FliE [bacterium]
MEGGIKPVDWRFQPIEPLAGLKPKDQQAPDGDGTGPDFTELLKQQLDQVIDLQNEADQVQQDFAAGRIEDIEQVVLAVQKADLALNFALELRNKVIEAYQEISRMQI